MAPPWRPVHFVCILITAGTADICSDASCHLCFAALRALWKKSSEAEQVRMNVCNYDQAVYILQYANVGRLDRSEERRSNAFC